MAKTILQKNMLETIDNALNDIQNIDKFIMLYGKNDSFIFSMAGSIIDCESMVKCCIDHVTQDMDYDDFHRFILEINLFAAQLKVERFCSESELEE